MPLMRRLRPKDRNFWLGVVNGIIVNPGEAFLHSGLVLAPFLAVLGAPAVLIGLVPTLRVGGYFFPQLLVANRLSHQPYKLPYYHVTSWVRTGALVVMTLGAFFLGRDYPLLTTLVLLVAISVNAVASGVAAVPFADVTAKIVEHGRLGTFWALRNSVGGILVLGAGLVIRAVLDSDMQFPNNFGVIFVLGTVFSGVAYATFSLVKEPPGVPGVRRPLLGMFKEVPKLLKQDLNLRRFLRVRFLGLAALLAEPFYAIYAIEHLGAPESAVGVYIIIATVGTIAGNFLARGPANRALNVNVLQVGYVFGLLAPLLALLTGNWVVFSAVFALTAIGNAAVGVAAWNLLYAIAPAGDRPLYIGLANTVLALPAVAPVAAGAIYSLAGPLPLFVIAGALGVTTLAFSFRFKELRLADKRALHAAIGGDERPPSDSLKGSADAALTSKGSKSAEDAAG